MNHLRSILLASLATLTVGLIILCSLAGQQGAKVRARYAEMTAAMSSSDTNAVLALVAPQYRSEFDGLRLMRMKSFAKPLRPGSKVVIVGHEATVWPSPNWYLCGVWPVGDTVEMTKVGRSWFFTGKVQHD